MPRKKTKARKKHFEPITIKELMALSSRQLRTRAYAKRPLVGRPKPNAPYAETAVSAPTT
jgi:hypothetical protein